MDTPAPDRRHPLARARDDRGWSQTDLARALRRAAAEHGEQCPVTRHTVSRWERGVLPSHLYRRLLADVLGTSLPEVTAALRTTESSDQLSGRTALEDLLGAAVDRRRFLVISGSTLTTLAATAAGLPAGEAGPPHRDGADLAEWLCAHAADLRRLSTAKPSAETTRVLDAHLDSAVRLTRSTAGSRSPALHTAIATLAQARGWIAFDQGLHAGAQRFWAAGLRAAATADDPALGPALLADLAYQCTWMERPGTAVRLLTEALHRTREPRPTALLHLRLARSYARLGEAEATQTQVSAAERALSRAPRDDDTWCAWMSPADLAADAGECWRDLGSAAAAAASIEEGLALLPQHRTRTRAVMGVYAAHAALDRGQVAGAAVTAHRALDTARETGAARCIALAHGFLPRLDPYRGVREVEELHASASPLDA
ncbi:hypothetical protein [Nocardiopsis trehalosi]|uniref:hypothetical protein n=1 Tax=Nocardiopsis trehalosi TaxID=109329 RepID=UPI000834E62E|nr:hypothetical protein [Nocardiopsis trehalosi]